MRSTGLSSPRRNLLMRVSSPTKHGCIAWRTATQTKSHSHGVPSAAARSDECQLCVTPLSFSILASLAPTAGFTVGRLRRLSEALAFWVSTRVSTQHRASPEQHHHERASFRR